MKTNKMAKIETLEVTVKYRVGLGGLNVPKKVIEQLESAVNNYKELGMDTRDDKRYAEATEWLIDNIKERDCFDWSAEIDDFTT